MRHPRRAAALAGLVGIIAGSCSRAPEFDLVLRGGAVLDGTGAGTQRIDVGITGERITALGDLAGRGAGQTIDASGRIVAPGFIDLLGRSGLTLLADGLAESHLRQGITTEILADSPAFWSGTTADASALRQLGLTLDWHDATSYFTKLESRGSTVNVGTLVPLSAARAAPGGAPAFIDAGMDEGAFGLSDDAAADAAELAAAAAVVGRHDGLMLVPLESPLAASDDALLAVGARTHRILVSGMARVEDGVALTELLRRFIRARERDVVVWTVVTPYAPAAAPSDVMVREALKAGSLVGTDTSAAGSLTGAAVPAAFGSFPRLLGQFVRDDRAIPLPEAIRRITSSPASILQLPDRGIIRDTYFADVVIFDPHAVADRATAAQPQQFPTGIDYVIVNGVVTLTPAGLTGARPGYRLLHQQPAH